MTSHDRHVWEEIATAGFIVALLSWILYHLLNPTKPGSGSSGSVQAPGVNTYVEPGITQPDFSLPPLTEPGYPALPSSGQDPCGCQGCSVNTTTDPTLAMINLQTNAAIAALQAANTATLDAIASLGNEYDPNQILYVVAGG